MENYFKNRRTIRRYTDKPVTDELLEQIIDEAQHAPTTGNMQLYSVVITRDMAMKEALAPTHFNQPQIKDAAVVLTVCADYNRFVKWCEQRNAVPGYDNLMSLATAVLDAAIFAQQICTAAENHGLGTCYLGTTLYNAPDIARILQLPERVIPVTTITIGYPADKGEETGRLPVAAIIHNEHYHDYSADDINRLYAEKEARADSRRFVEENGKQTLAQVFTDIRYTLEANNHFSEMLANYIAEAYPGVAK